MTAMRHIFEHLGKPPYKYDGFAELIFTVPGTGICKAGGSCDHCGTAIRNAFYFTSSDGKRFKVGSSCVTKSGDKGLRKNVSDEIRRAKKAKEAAELVELKTELAVLAEETREKTQALGHPFMIRDLTYYTYVTWLLEPRNLKYAGYTKIKRVVTYLRKLKG